jgi:hypothetical protein
MDKTVANEQRLWELTKYTITELHDEIDRRLEEKANLYAVKDVIDFDENGEPFNTETI